MTASSFARMFRFLIGRFTRIPSLRTPAIDAGFVRLPIRISVITLLVFSAGLLAPSAYAQHPLDYLYGTWEGSGKTSGMASSVRFIWGPALGGRYTSLQIHNRMSGDDGAEYLFEGIGYYQPSGDPDNRILTGVWVDSQGDILWLRATLEDRTLIALWGTEGTKQGRSEYRLLPDGTLEAVDSIRTDAGEWLEFGRALLVRDSDPNSDLMPLRPG
jgi:hypothetical protein